MGPFRQTCPRSVRQPGRVTMTIPRVPTSCVIIAVLLAMPTKSRAQAGAAPDLPDSTVQRLLTRFPCPRTVPHGWVASDSANGRGVRCSLLLAAARGLITATTSDERVNPYTSVCATLEDRLPVRNIGTMWRVVFFGDSLRRSSVIVDRRGRAVSFQLQHDPKPSVASTCKPAV